MHQNDRNKKLHNKNVQRSRIKGQYKKERQNIIKQQYPQVKKYIEDKALNLENCTINYIRYWVYVPKELKRRAEKYKKKDIRGYFT